MKHATMNAALRAAGFNSRFCTEVLSEGSAFILRKKKCNHRGTVLELDFSADDPREWTVRQGDRLLVDLEYDDVARFEPGPKADRRSGLFPPGVTAAEARGGKARQVMAYLSDEERESLQRRVDKRGTTVGAAVREAVLAWGR